MTPDIRLPEWHKIKVRAKSWNPASKELIMAVDWVAFDVALHDLSVKILWPAGFGTPSPEVFRKLLKPRETGETLHHVAAPENFDGWIEIGASAKPDAEDLRQLVAGISTYSPALRAILQNEIDSLKEALPLGRNVPLHLDDQMAVCLPREMILLPVFSIQERPLFFWLPNVVLGKGLLSHAYEGFKKAVQARDLEKALHELEKLESQVALATEPLLIQNGKDGEMFLQPLFLREALRVDRFTLQGLRTTQLAISGLEALAKTGTQGFVNGFYQANIGTFYHSLGKETEAGHWYEKALEIIPAWPMLERWKIGNK